SRRYAPPTVRHVVYEGGTVLAELDTKENAFRFVDELLREREEREAIDNWWRVTFHVYKGRHVTEWRSEAFIKAVSLEHAAARAVQAFGEQGGGWVQPVAVRQVSYRELQLLERADAHERVRTVAKTES